ncbi:fumarylacetoacetate hydrolase family protein [Endozoicomonas sp. SM1973]|uniref:Fumarylacetoacetate hydrolase family protein n=1 Tax=Spartinivicinus marinus TaxID=2994442 RepID=A0A853I0I2_9GAMM|nr:fumarylacetoacetate hydrolase family protein [Spartinivicinus marinus]MCX4027169.1 fumarylacetoacetate hydrolase family protein [Spartinivicinus marinus]NYZ66109.1 fumarylacetoacetate hydrolase family protein [Spartinivicinus marinus]
MQQYHHKWIDGSPINLSCNKVVCIGRNYAAHAAELDNPIPDTPLLFIKPTTAIVPLEQPLQLPDNLGEVHYETELAILIQHPVKSASPEAAVNAVGGLGLALDLTLRDLQSQLKEKGHPWEKAKAFDGSCPLSPFIPYHASMPLDNLHFELKINGLPVQQGHTKLMLTSVANLISYASQFFTLLPGDVILTGTPKGVGKLASGDQLTLQLQDYAQFSTSVI